MINLKLSKSESDLIQLFFDLCPKWKQIITKQIQQSNVQREYSDSNYSVYFRNEIETDKLGIAAKMPVEIILGNIDIPAENIITVINGCNVISPCIISIRDADAVGGRMYFSEGLLTELEIYSVSGKKLGEINQKTKPCTYIVFDTEVIEDRGEDKTGEKIRQGR